MLSEVPGTAHAGAVAARAGMHLLLRELHPIGAPARQGRGAVDDLARLRRHADGRRRPPGRGHPRRDIVGGLRRFSAMDPEARAPVDLNEVIERAIHWVRKGTGAGFEMHWQSGPPCGANGSAGQLQQVLMNLLQNDRPRSTQPQNTACDGRTMAELEFDRRGGGGAGVPTWHLHGLAVCDGAHRLSPRSACVHAFVSRTWRAIFLLRPAFRSWSAAANRLRGRRQYPNGRKW